MNAEQWYINLGTPPARTAGSLTTSPPYLISLINISSSQALPSPIPFPSDQSVTMPPKPAPKAKGNKETCNVCKVTTKSCNANKKGAVRCNICLHWYHPDCAGVTQEEYVMFVKLLELRKEDLWTCMTCASGISVVNKKVSENSALIGKIDKRLEQVEGKQDLQEEKQKSSNIEMGKLKEELASMREDMERMKENSGTAALREIDDRTARQQNIIIHRVPESGHDNARDRMGADQDAVQIIINAIGLIQINVKDAVKFVRRRGKLDTSKSEPRPLQVGFRYQADQEKVLSNSRHLAENKKLEHVSIVRDLTDMERKKEREMASLSKRKNLQRSEEDVQLGLVYKVVGERGRKREIQVPLRPGELITQDGLVLDKDRYDVSHQQASVATGPNLTPIGDRRRSSFHQGNGLLPAMPAKSMLLPRQKSMRDLAMDRLKGAADNFTRVELDRQLARTNGIPSDSEGEEEETGGKGEGGEKRGRQDSSPQGEYKKPREGEVDHQSFLQRQRDQVNLVSKDYSGGGMEDEGGMASYEWGEE